MTLTQSTTTPARPLPTTAYRSGAVILAALAVFIFYQFINELLPSSTEARLTLGLALPIAIVAGPLLGAIGRSRESDQKWRDGDPVQSRVLAAKARNLSVTSLGLSATLSVIALVGFVIFVNGGAVQKTFFNGEFMLVGLVDISKALLINIQIAVGAQVIAMTFGLLLAIGRLLPGKGFMPVRVLCITYIDVFRGIPSVVLIYLVCFGLPLSGVPILSEGDPIVYAIIALSMTYSGYNAELYRAGLEAINPDQTSAALSMGLSYPDVMRFVLIPQMARNIAAPMLSQFIGLQKDTALVIVVGIIDAFSQAKIYAANDFNLSAVTTVAFLFVLITIPQTRLVDYILTRTSTNRKVK